MCVYTYDCGLSLCMYVLVYSGVSRCAVSVCVCLQFLSETRIHESVIGTCRCLCNCVSVVAGLSHCLASSRLVSSMCILHCIFLYHTLVYVMWICVLLLNIQTSELWLNKCGECIELLSGPWLIPLKMDENDSLILTNRKTMFGFTWNDYSSNSCIIVRFLTINLWFVNMKPINIHFNVTKMKQMALEVIQLSDQTHFPRPFSDVQFPS